MSDDVGFAVPFTKAREKVSVRGSGVQQSKHNVIICRVVRRSQNPWGELGVKGANKAEFSVELLKSYVPKFPHAEAKCKQKSPELG